MLFNSFKFMLFFPLAVAGYFLCPKKLRYLWLLAVSAFFYMCWHPAYILLVGISAGITWAGGLLLARVVRRGPRRALLAACVTANLAILFFFKYYGFAADNLALLGLHLPALDVLLPIGISFYTFQALGYVIDVFRGEIAPERNPLRYAAFLLFFPQLVAGPIERAGNLLPQFYELHTFDYRRARAGLLRMGWGFVEKMILADRLAIYVDAVYASLGTDAPAAGLPVLLAVVLFSLQIYCDFASYSNIAVGAAQVLGFRLSRNFDAPLFACSVGEYWRRWHITFSSWLRDYLYIPLGGNRKGAARKCLNLMITFLCSGLWHGAAWTYILWGGLHGAVLCGESILGARARKRNGGHAAAPKHSPAGQFLRWFCTFAFLCLAFVLFRADSLAQAGELFRALMRGWHPAQLWDGSLLAFGLDAPDLTVAFLAVGGLAAGDWLDHRRRQSGRTGLLELVESAPTALRWCVYLGLFFAVFLFGIYGVGVAEKPFIYFQF